MKRIDSGDLSGCWIVMYIYRQQISFLYSLRWGLAKNIHYLVHIHILQPNTEAVIELCINLLSQYIYAKNMLQIHRTLIFAKNSF